LPAHLRTSFLWRASTDWLRWKTSLERKPAAVVSGHNNDTSMHPLDALVDKFLERGREGRGRRGG